MISIEHDGSFNKTEFFLERLYRSDFFAEIELLAQEGVAALANATPVRSHLTANSWDVVIERSKSGVTITWTNSHVVDGVPLAILLQYGHGTGTGGYVEGRDYINPAIRPIFDKIANKVWKAVTTL